MFITGIVTLFSLMRVTFGDTIMDEDLKTNKEYQYDDMIFTQEQYALTKERGFFVPRKWPLRNGRVIVPFYFDASIPKGDPRRDAFKTAIKMYSRKTCIEWVETDRWDSEHKVQVYSGSGCNSNVGMLSESDNKLSLAPNCVKVSTVVHEMGHAMGLVHTQSRDDRDKYVQVWWDNIQDGRQHNFDIKFGLEAFGVPYDYLSIMHYRNSYFSKNGSFTLTPREPFAMFMIGRERYDFRWSDAALLNKGLQCDEVFSQTCGKQDCKNGGYVGKNCKCSCPENTQGDNCEIRTGPLFSYTPKCGGIIETEGDIQSDGFGVSSTTDVCIFHIKAPKCQKPQITITRVAFRGDYCDWNMLAIQVSQEYFGYMYCGNGKVPVGQAFISDSSEAAVYYYTTTKGSPSYGFKANIKFLESSSC